MTGISVTLPDDVIDEVARRAAALVFERFGQEQQPESPFMTVAEAAAFARCKRQRIDDLLSARRLTRHKDGRRTLVSKAELLAHLAAQTGPGASPQADSNSGPNRATVTSPGNKDGM